MAETKVWVFFYGSYINLNVLTEVDLIPEHWEVVRLAGFDIRTPSKAYLLRQAYCLRDYRNSNP
jgi:hypothetical protein